MDKFYMAGTEHTGRYVVVLLTALGRVGYRDLGGGVFRIRIEPANQEARSKLRPSFPGYKDGIGGSEQRFSTVIQGGENGLRSVIANAVKALVPGGQVEVNPAAPDWAKELVEACNILTPPQPPAAEAQPEVDTDTKPAETTATDDHETLVAEARKLGIRGVSSRWTVATLKRKIAERKTVNFEAPQETRGAETDSEERDRLISEVRQRKLPGANLAGGWSLATLRAKLAAV